MRDRCLAIEQIDHTVGSQRLAQRLEDTPRNVLSAVGESLDGTCIALFNGCDDVSDFTFQMEASAILASQALLNQVFLDGVLGNFDSSPELMAGCENTGRCISATPYGFNILSAASPVLGATSHNWSPDFSNGVDSVLTFATDGAFDTGNTSSGSDLHWVSWSPSPPVPQAVPMSRASSAALFLALGLTGLAARRRSLRS